MFPYWYSYLNFAIILVIMAATIVLPLAIIYYIVKLIKKHL